MATQTANLATGPDPTSRRIVPLYPSNPPANTSTLTKGASFASTESSNSYVHVEPPSLPNSPDPPSSHHKPRLVRSQSATTSGELTASRDAVRPPASRGSQNEDEDASNSDKEGAGWHMRHGWDYSAEQLRELSSNYFLYYNDSRHDSMGNPARGRPKINTEEWRMRDRLKTQQALLAICLNIGVDPPDVIKPQHCAKLEGWTDPQSSGGLSGTAPMSTITKALQAQYEQISMRTRFTVLPDPTVEEMRKQCSTVRKRGKEERVLFHYNGHGVPKPTPSGEIWVFNKHYTQYIPISLFDLQAWLEAPSLLVYDCSDAGSIIGNYNRFVDRHVADQAEALRRDPSISVKHFADCIHLAACRSGETLPTNPMLPADLFTSCLTTPIEIAVRFFAMQNPLSSSEDQEQFKLIPGKISERRTPIGELNWIFTAITDTIAWNSLPRTLFKKLFRQDLMVAALFRNFLLAQRIMRKYDLHPQCHPDIPSCHEHPLWQSWDLTIELVLSQVQNFADAKAANVDYNYVHSDFFAEQLTAFEVYLDQEASEGKEPQQLPIVLQVLLSQVHRIRALILLSKFLDLGPWAVKLALGIGIFPYVNKLLQSQAMELKPVMVFIWCRILAVDQTCQADLLKDNGYNYFLQILKPSDKSEDYNGAYTYVTSVQGFPIRSVDEHRAMCAFIVAMFCKDHPAGQDAAQSEELIDECLNQASWPKVDHPILRQWSCLCLSMLWKNHDNAKWAGIRQRAHVRLCDSMWDPVPEVRAALLHAITNLLGISDLTRMVAELEQSIASRLLVVTNDGSNLVRKELVIFFSTFIRRYQNKFVVTAYEEMAAEYPNLVTDQTAQAWALVSGSPGNQSDEDHDNESVSRSSLYSSLWKKVLILSVDPDPEVSRDSKIIVDNILKALVESPLGPYTQPVHFKSLFPDDQERASLARNEENHNPQLQNHVQNAEHVDGYFSMGMKRTASVAASLKSLAFGTSDVPERPSPPQMTKSHTTLSSLDERRRPAPPNAPNIPSNSPPKEIPRAPPSQYTNQPPNVPLGKYFQHRTSKESHTLPLTSTFFDWSADYFREPQMKRNEADEPGSKEYNERLWRRNRNERILESTQKLKEQARSSRWDNQAGTFDTRVQPMKLCFHQYDNHLAVSDNGSGIRVWDWQRQVPLNRFSNGNPLPRSKITGIRFINEDDAGILMTGSSDGVIKLFRHYDDPSNVYLAASYRALSDIVPSTTNAGLVFDWLQGRGWTLAAGDAKVIRVWSAAHELCTHEIPARSGSCVTSLTADQVSGNIVVAGFGDGAVRVYDQREGPASSRVQQWKEHSQWITNVHMQRGGQRELVSACRAGEVKLWDIRMAKSLRTIRAAGTKDRDTLRSLSVHEHAPVLAAGSERSAVRVYSMAGHSLSAFPPHESVMGGVGVAGYGAKAAPVSATAFHPHRMVLGAASLGDTRVTLWSCREKGGGGRGSPLI